VNERLAPALADRYRIERELGQGGMATVYLAQDLKHDRLVALKVLKPELAAVLGADRFVVEIKTTAALQHPHILPLFDSGTADGFLYYVMPYIQGETLRNKLDRETQLGIDEAVRITREVADALDYAHRHGVIHRDIKPENILLHDGRPMVADFGIALAVSAAAGGRMTETGLSLGTPHYMSPEQATAEKELTARSDIYSLGCVLYEMLTGSPPHVGATAQQIVMKIVMDEARPVTELRKSVPPNVAAAAAKALEKLPADRFESAKAFADALGNPAFAVAGASGQARASVRDGRWRARFVALAVVATLMLGVALVAWRSRWLRPERPTTLFDLSLGGITPSGNSDVVISPDGLMVAVAGVLNGEQAIYLRRLDGDPDFRKVPGTDGADGSPSFSPDSKWIAFRRQSDYKLVRVLASGGSAMALAQLARTVFPFVHWGTADHLVYHAGGTVGPVRIAASGGPPDTLGTAGAARTPFLLPDGSGLLYNRGAVLWVLDFETDSSTVLLPFAVQPTYVATGHLLYIAENGGLFAVLFDLGRHRITGQPVRVVERVANTLLRRGYSVSRDGVLVYHDGPSTFLGIFSAATRFLVVTPGSSTDTLRLPPGRHLNPRFSPDGRSVAYEFGSGRVNATDLYTFDLVAGTNTQITFAEDNDDPVWSPDGKLIAFTRGTRDLGEDVFVKRADNSGSEEMLLSLPGNQNPVDWPASDTILIMSTEAGQSDLLLMPPRSGEKPGPYLQAPWTETEVHVSPDRKLAALTSFEAGASDIWIRDFPVAQGKWRVSSNELSSAPRWSPDGKYVYYWRTSSVVSDTLFRARVDRIPAVVVRAPEVVLALDVAGVENWDLHPDGKRIIVTVNDAPPAGPVAAGSAAVPASRYLVALNWFAELKKLTQRDGQ
jgi:eukaryotic-like serine/threonine-protein kinase